MKIGDYKVISLTEMPVGVGHSVFGHCVATVENGMGVKMMSVKPTKDEAIADAISQLRSLENRFDQATCKKVRSIHTKNEIKPVAKNFEVNDIAVFGYQTEFVRCVKIPA